MCMITYLPSGIEVPEDEIRNGATWNNDGYGWAVAADTGVMLTGRYMDIDPAMETFKATREAYPGAPAVFHSRLATHGTVTLNNVHPFSVGKYAVVAHNGILPTKFQPSSKNAHMSDTAIMATYWLAGRAQIAGIWTRKERKRIGRIIGAGNKLAILSVSPFLPEPRGYLVNGRMGYWTDNGAWHSSSDYKYEWHKGYSSGWSWDGDDYGYRYKGGTVSAKESAFYHLCPKCNKQDDVDERSNFCLACNFCLDCLNDIQDCNCYLTPGASQNIEFNERGAIVLGSSSTTGYHGHGFDEDEPTTRDGDYYAIANKALNEWDAARQSVESAEDAYFERNDMRDPIEIAMNVNEEGNESDEHTV